MDLNEEDRKVYDDVLNFTKSKPAEPGNILLQIHHLRSSPAITGFLKMEMHQITGEALDHLAKITERPRPDLSELSELPSFPALDKVLGRLRKTFVIMKEFLEEDYTGEEFWYIFQYTGNEKHIHELHRKLELPNGCQTMDLSKLYSEDEIVKERENEKVALENTQEFKGKIVVSGDPLEHCWLDIVDAEKHIDHTGSAARWM